MGKVAFMYSGQGSQYLGMGKELYEQYDSVKDIYQQAENTLGFSISDISFTDEEKINNTKYTQPSLVTLSYAIHTLLLQNDILPDAVFGLSLGEYSALLAAGVFTLNEAVYLTYKRGTIMSESVPNNLGGMAAIIGMEREALLDVCDSVAGVCEIANYNCPGQLVIGGEIDSVNEAMILAKERGAKRAILLNVSGPFHTSLLKEASEAIAEEIDHITLKENQIPVVMNVTADYLNHEDTKELLKKQVYSSVYFEDSIRKLIDDGFDTFVEVGPSKVLSSFVKKTDRTVKVMNVENVESLQKVLAHFKNEEE